MLVLLLLLLLLGLLFHRLHLPRTTKAFLQPGVSPSLPPACSVGNSMSASCPFAQAQSSSRASCRSVLSREDYGRFNKRREVSGFATTSGGLLAMSITWARVRRVCLESLPPHSAANPMHARSRLLSDDTRSSAWRMFRPKRYTRPLAARGHTKAIWPAMLLTSARFK